MKKIVLSVLVCLVGQLAAYAQWVTNGSNIYYNTGFVGLGITNPLVKLSISGDLNSERMTIYSSADPVVTLYHVNGTTTAPTPIVAGNNLGYYEFGGYDGTTSQRASWITGVATQAWTSTARGAGIAFSTTPDNSTTIAERMRIDQFGNVGIGTTNTQGYLLAVNGNAIFTKVVVKPYANWPDYVFVPGYKLAPLDSVSNYVRENGHLPGIVPADSVEKNGLDLGDNQTAMLKKIEELTLYIIQQNKEMADLKERVKNLETHN
jgi:hypothetical protein